MNNFRLCIIVPALVILVGCSKKAPEIPPPEPTAAVMILAAPSVTLQQLRAGFGADSRLLA